MMRRPRTSVTRSWGASSSTPKITWASGARSSWLPPVSTSCTAETLDDGCDDLEEERVGRGLPAVGKVSGDDEGIDRLAGGFDARQGPAELLGRVDPAGEPPLGDPSRCGSERWAMTCVGAGRPPLRAMRHLRRGRVGVGGSDAGATAVTKVNKSVLNKGLRHLAGHGWFVELEHTGGRSGGRSTCRSWRSTVATSSRWP